MGRFADCFFERQQLFVADIAAQQAGEVAIGTWVRHRLQENALQRLRRFVATETDPRQFHNFPRRTLVVLEPETGRATAEICDKDGHAQERELLARKGHPVPGHHLWSW